MMDWTCVERNGATAMLLAAGALAGAASCSTTVCTLEARTGLAVVVVDTSTGRAVCGVQVVATDGSYRELLTEVPNSPDAGEVDAGSPTCFFYGAAERAGTYDITADAPGFHVADAGGIVVSHDACHVIQRRVTLMAAPQ